MLRLASICLTAALLALALVACGGDDDGGATATPGDTDSPLDGGSVTPGGETATPGGDLKTTPPGGPGGETTAPPTAPGDVPTAPPTSSEGIPAIAPEDQGAFAGQFQGQPIEQEPCSYDPTTALVACSGQGYAIDPPLVGQDISCNLWVVSGVPELVQCTSAEPLATTYYEIME